MKTLMLMSAMLLTACAHSPLPLTAESSGWEAFGKQQALDGQLKISQQSLEKRADVSVWNPDLYSAYSIGYEMGKQEYCSQSAYILGVKQERYLGICDDINIFFQQDYVSGRHSTASM
ncbi:DUF2799 domain-containing protein [Vibrio paucivorans]